MTAVTPKTYTGEDAVIQIGMGSASGMHSDFAIGDFSVTLDRGTVEQPLVGQTGNFFKQGAMSAEGSFTQAKFGTSVLDIVLKSVISGTKSTRVWISGLVGPSSLHFFFKSCQITSFDISIGDASTVTEGSLDYAVIDPYNITVTPIANGGIWLKD